MQRAMEKQNWVENVTEENRDRDREEWKNVNIEFFPCGSFGYFYFTVGQNAQLSERMLFCGIFLDPLTKSDIIEKWTRWGRYAAIYTQIHIIPACATFEYTYIQPFFLVCTVMRMRFSMHEIFTTSYKGFFVFIYFFESFFLAVILKKDMPTYTGTSIDIFLLWIKNFHQALRRSERKKGKNDKSTETGRAFPHIWSLWH